MSWLDFRSPHGLQPRARRRRLYLSSRGPAPFLPGAEGLQIAKGKVVQWSRFDLRFVYRSVAVHQQMFVRHATLRLCADDVIDFTGIRIRRLSAAGAHRLSDGADAAR